MSSTSGRASRGAASSAIVHDLAVPQAASAQGAQDDNVAHWRRIALAASEQGEIDAALRCWQRVQRLEPDARDPQFHIACAHALAGRREYAGEVFAELAADQAVAVDLRQRSLRLARLVDAGGAA